MYLWRTLVFSVELRCTVANQREQFIEIYESSRRYEILSRVYFENRFVQSHPRWNTKAGKVNSLSNADFE